MPLGKALRPGGSDVGDLVGGAYLVGRTMMSDPRLEERDEMREAIALASATENVGRRYCEVLIAASRDVVGVWYKSKRPGLNTALGNAIKELQNLVGRP